MRATSLPTWPAPKSMTSNRSSPSSIFSTLLKASVVLPPQHWPSASPRTNRRWRSVSPERSISRAILSAVYSRLPPPRVPRISDAPTHMRVPDSRGVEPRVSTTRISMKLMDRLEHVLGRRGRFERHRLARARGGADGVRDRLEHRKREHQRGLADRLGPMRDLAHVLAFFPQP